MPSSKATQEFVPIQEIRDGIAILKDGGLRAILMASSVNFALKSEENQQAIIAQFQNFLNSLDFSVQIHLESRRLDIRPYLTLLEERKKVQTSELLKIQIREYIEYIKGITDNTNIMTKTFFVVVPYSPALIETGGAGKLGALVKKNGGGKSVTDHLAHFEEYRSQLEQRVSIVEQGLIRTGVRTVLLGTEEIIELFYKIFNRAETEKPLRVG